MARLVKNLGFEGSFWMLVELVVESKIRLLSKFAVRSRVESLRFLEIAYLEVPIMRSASSTLSKGSLKKPTCFLPP